MFVITSEIIHNKATATVFYVGHGTGEDTIWSDKRADSMSFADRESAEDVSEELMQTTTIREI